MESINPTLLHKAKVLKASKFFTDEAAPLSQKQLIFYVLAGVKPLSEIIASHMEAVSPTEYVGRQMTKPVSQDC